MAIYKTARFRVRRDGLAPALAAIRAFVEAVKANEPGTKLYVSLQEKEDETAFLQLMIFADAAAEERHRGSEWVRAFTGVLYPLTVGGVEFTDYESVATT